MRFIINREQFLKGLVTASKPVPSKGALPILLFLKLQLDENGLNILGSNGEVAISYTIPTTLDGKEIIRNTRDGAILLQSKYITEIARKSSGEELCFEVIDGTVVKIDDDKSSFQLNCVRAEEYPDVNLATETTVFDISCAELANMVEQTAFAASTKEQTPTLTALNLEADNGKLTATALDSTRLAKKTLELKEAVTFNVNIPARTITDIIRLFEGNETVSVSIGRQKALFKFGNVVVSTSLINGDYPRTSNITPRNFNYYLEVNAQELISAIERVSLLSVEHLNFVKLTMTEDEVIVASKSAEIGSAVEKINTFQFSGDRLTIMFNSEHVVAAIKALKNEDVTFCFVGESKTFVIKNPKDDSITQLLTPRRI